MSQSPKLSSALQVKESAFGKELDPNYFGLMIVGYNSIRANTNAVFILTAGDTAKLKKFSFNENNFYHLLGYFTARKTIKANWINHYDEYIAPIT